MAEFGAGIVAGVRVEISPHFDLWMRGARFGTVKKITPISGIAHVRMDHPHVKKIQKFSVVDLKLT